VSLGFIEQTMTEVLGFHKCVGFYIKIVS